ncbi:hypothetical protein D3C85_1345270 [compost metagenome]
MALQITMSTKLRKDILIITVLRCRTIQIGYPISQNLYISQFFVKPKREKLCHFKMKICLIFLRNISKNAMKILLGGLAVSSATVNLLQKIYLIKFLTYFGIVIKGMYRFKMLYLLFLILRPYMLLKVKIY